MERNINYIVIGAIFCALTTAMIAFIFWIGKFGIDERRMKIYHVYTEDEIAGISVNTPVKYKGISVGNVVSIGFKDGDIGTVQIKVAINKKIPVREGSELVIDSDGFVGMGYLNLKQNEYGNVIEDSDKAHLTLTKNALSRLMGSAEGMSSDMKQILNNIKVMTDGKIMEELIGTLNSFQSTKAHIDETLISANKLIKDIDKVILRGDFSFKDLLVPVINGAQGSIYLFNTSLEKIGHFLDRLERDPYDALLGKRN